jgi:hypothetical protein
MGEVEHDDISGYSEGIYDLTPGSVIMGDHLFTISHDCVKVIDMDDFSQVLLVIDL